jgi:FHS family L-fucose permease-like MFS transporter
VLVGQQFILSGIEHTPVQIAALTAAERATFYSTESAAVQVPYLIIGAIVLVWALLFAISRFPRTRDSDEAGNHGGGFSHIADLLRDRYFMLSVAAQFFFVGAQIGIWSYLIRYTQVNVPGTPEKIAANYLMASLVLFMIGRFTGAALMRYVAPARLLATYSLINIVLCTVALALAGPAGLYALVAASFFMSIMFPTIFALGLDGLDDEKRKLGSSLLVMSIIGGAVLTALMGATSDAFGISWAMAVPLFCFAIVLTFALRSGPAGVVAAIRV